MKMRVIFYLFLLICLTALSGCFSPPEFPDEPTISFENLVFRKGDISSGDSLILSINFQDGNGDIGLSGVDDDFPYHPFDIIVDSNGDSVFFRDGPRANNPNIIKQAVPPFFRRAPNGNEILFSEVDNRNPVYNCPQYERLFNPDGQEVDTLYIFQNENNSNISVKFFRRVNGEPREFDFRAIASRDLCGEDFNGRFPIFDQQNFEDGKALAGTIDYSMISVGFELAFRRDTFQIVTQIKDRNLNESDTVITPPFVILPEFRLVREE